MAQQISESDLEKIPKITVLIKTPKWKQPADPRSDAVYAAPSAFIQENALFLPAPHDHIGQDNAVHHIQFRHALRQQFRKALSQPLLQPIYIAGIQYNGTPHARAALVAVLTSMTVCFYHIIAVI